MMVMAVKVTVIDSGSDEVAVMIMMVRIVNAGLVFNSVDTRHCDKPLILILT